MPILSGRKGLPGLLAVPALRRRFGLDPEFSTGGGPLGSGVLRNRLRGSPFRSVPLDATSSRFITGVTRDSAGAPLGGVTCALFETRTNTWVASTVSDGSGNFTFPMASGGPFFLVFYKAGTPDVFGSSANTLVGALP